MPSKGLGLNAKPTCTSISWSCRHPPMDVVNSCPLSEPTTFGSSPNGIRKQAGGHSEWSPSASRTGVSATMSHSMQHTSQQCRTLWRMCSTRPGTSVMSGSYTTSLSASSAMPGVPHAGTFSSFTKTASSPSTAPEEPRGAIPRTMLSSFRGGVVSAVPFPPFHSFPKYCTRPSVIRLWFY